MGKAYLAISHDGMSVDIQFHDICVYPSLWRTVHDQHHLMKDYRKCGKREEAGCDMGRRLIILRAREL